jgi:hypothetical protein
LQKVDVEKVVNELLKHQLSDGGFGGDEGWRESNLWETYLAIDTFYMLNRLSAINKEKVINYILSLKNPDGSFRHSKSEEHYDEATPLAVIILTLLGEDHRVDEKTINWIINDQREDGGFGDVLHTCLSLTALRYLGRLDNTVLTKAVNYVLSLQNLDGGFGWWKGDVWSWLDPTDYGTGVLKITLNATSDYFVLVSSPYGIPIGGGWYKKGATATVSISPTLVDKDFFSYYVFEGWKVGDTIVSTFPTYSFTVDKSFTLVASWRTELKIISILIILGPILIVMLAAITLARRRRVVSPPSPLPPEKDIEREIKKYEGYLDKLEQLRKEGKVSDKVYEKLKQEYEKKLEELVDKLKK